MRSLILICLVVMLVIVGCNENNDRSELEAGNRDGDASQPIDSPTPADTSLELNGYLAYTSNSSLYAIDFSTGNVEEIEVDVMDDYLYLSPDQTALYYAVVDTDQTRIFQYVFASGQKQQIAQLPLPFGSSSIWRMGGWSPNGEWVVIVSSRFSQGPLLVDLTGESQQIAYARSLKRGWWTENNEFIFITQDPTNPGDDLGPILSVELVNVSTGDISDITADVPLKANYSEHEFLDVLAQSGYPIATENLAPRPHVVTPIDRFNAASGEYCWEYQIVNESTIVYEQTDIFNLGEPTILDDGSLVFVETSFPECSFLNAPVGEIVALAPDGQEIIITDRLMSFEDRNNAWAFELRGRFDIAPDQQHIVFIATNNEEGNALHVAHLPDGESTQLTIDGTLIEHVRAVVWGR